MIAGLRSDDQRLYELSKVILAESNAEADHHVFIPELSTPLHTADVFIQDQLPEPNRHIFLLDRSDLDEAGADLLGAVQVPRSVSKGALAGWLEQAGNLRAESGRQSVNGKNPMLASLVAEELGPLTDIQKEALGRTQNSLRRLTRMTSAMIHLAVGWRVRRVPNLRGAICESYRGNCKFASKGSRIAVRGYPQAWERRSENPMEGARNGAHAERRGRGRGRGRI